MKRCSVSKLVRPGLPMPILQRPRLLQKVIDYVQQTSDVGRRVVLVYAPAGYGKTTLLATVAGQLALPDCWCVLDATDGQPLGFFQLLLASLRQRFPTFGMALDPALSSLLGVEGSAQLLAYLDYFLDLFTSTLEQEITEDFALFLCNYHEIAEHADLSRLLSRFLQQMPASCRLFVESRARPSALLIDPLDAGQLLSIDMQQLRFSPDEIRELARLRHLELSEQEAQQIEESFEGWIVGILLCTQLHVQDALSVCSRRSSLGSDPDPFQGRRAYLFDYLVREVFARQPDDYLFLQETTILRQMTPALCNALLDISDAQVHLSHLERHGVFLTHYRTATEDLFVYHPVVRDLLTDELRRTHPARFKALHLRAVELLRGEDDGEAIAHALAADSFELAMQLLEMLAGQWFAQGDLTMLAGWLDALPPEQLGRSARLLLVRATLFLEESDLTRVPTLLEQALTVLPDDQDAPVLQAEILLAQAKCLLQQGDYTQAQQLSEQALTLLPASETETRAVAHQLKGSCAAYFTHFTTCIVELQQALQLYRYNTKMRQVAKLHTMLANFYGMTGHNMLSEHHRTRAITCWEKLHDEWGRIDNIMGLGAIKERQGAYDEAEQLFTQALLLSQGVLRYKCGEAYALTSLGEIYQERDQFQRALVAFEDSLNLARQLDDTYLTCYVFCQLARTHQLMGDAHSALHMLRQLEQSGALPDADGSSSYERAFFALTLGTILLHEGQIHKAAVHLAAAESAFAEVKHEQIQTMIRRAACLLVQERRDTALAQVEKALHLAEAFGYEALVSRELARYPTLLASVKATFPQLWQQFTLPEPIAPPSVSVALPIIPVPTLRIQVLGEPAVFLNETPIRHWRSARAMELFFLLLEAQEPLPKERIVAALWQDEMAPPDQTWRSTLHYLRKILGNTCIVALHGTYALHLTPMYAVQQDSDTFVQTLARAREAQQTGDVEGASQELTTAVHLYQGDYLASLTHEWCLARRRELRQMCISAYQDLAVIAWQCHRVDESLAHWQELLTLDPTSEAAHLGVVRCYLAQGKRPEALRQYQRLVELLQGSFRLDAQLLL